MKTSNKKLEKQIESLYKVHGNMVQVNVMDIGKIFNMAKEQHLSGLDLESAVKNAITKYRLN